jgi:hypothetical protein
VTRAFWIKIGLRRGYVVNYGFDWGCGRFVCFCCFVATDQCTYQGCLVISDIGQCESFCESAVLVRLFCEGLFAPGSLFLVRLMPRNGQIGSIKQGLLLSHPKKFLTLFYPVASSCPYKEDHYERINISDLSFFEEYETFFCLRLFKAGFPASTNRMLYPRDIKQAIRNSPAPTIDLNLSFYSIAFLLRRLIHNHPHLFHDVGRLGVLYHLLKPQWEWVLNGSSEGLVDLYKIPILYPPIDLFYVDSSIYREG